MTTPASGESVANRVPTEFCYWQHIESAPARRRRKALKMLFGTDPVLPDEVIRKYAHSYYDADPVAEAFVRDVYLKHGQEHGRAMLEQALEHGVESVRNAPASLARLFEEIEREPEWFDRARSDLGAKVFRRWGTHLYSFAGAITLHGYRESSVAKPLAFTGAYAGESANRRFLETAQFWIDVSEPDGLKPGGEGIRTAVRVRIMHVFVRAKLLQHPDWDLGAWGVPISQGDALLTLMGGSFLPGYLLRLLGYRTTREEIEATLHFWRYVGHLVGVQPRWYPETIDEALGLIFTAHVKGAHASGDDARRLAQSYLELYAPTDADRPIARLAKRWEHNLQRAYIRLFLPPESHRAYQLPGAGFWCLHPLVQFPFIFLRETARRHARIIDDWVDRRTRRATKKWVAARLGERRPEYRAVEQFTR